MRAVYSNTQAGVRSCLNSYTVLMRIYKAHAEYGYSLNDIGDHLGVHYATVSKMVKRAQQVKWQGKT